MPTFGILHVASLIYLSVMVALVVSINDSDSCKQALRETARRSFKLLGGMAIVMGIVALLSWIG